MITAHVLSAAPSPWRVVSTAPLAIERVRKLLPDGLDADIVVLKERTESEAVVEVKGAHLVIGDFTFGVPISRRVIEAMDTCRLIQQPSVGYQQIDVAAASECGIPVANTAGANDIAVAEHTIMMALALLKQLVFADSATRRGEWPQDELLQRGHFELAGRTWGLIGVGRTGTEVARRLQAWGVKIIYFDVANIPVQLERDLRIRRVEINELLSKSDIISLHIPLNGATAGLMNMSNLGKMKPGSILINVARGGVIEESALIHVLENRMIAAAGLDVFVDEPLAGDHPLCRLNNVLLSPHAAGTTLDARRRIMTMVSQNLHRVIAGEVPQSVVNGTAI